MFVCLWYMPYSVQDLWMQKYRYFDINCLPNRLWCCCLLVCYLKYRYTTYSEELRSQYIVNGKTIETLYIIHPKTKTVLLTLCYKHPKKSTHYTHCQPLSVSDKFSCNQFCSVYRCQSSLSSTNHQLLALDFNFKHCL